MSTIIRKYTQEKAPHFIEKPFSFNTVFCLTKRLGICLAHYGYAADTAAGIETEVMG